MSFIAVPGTLIGEYVVISEIGKGGMSTVYLAEHAGLGRKVALKILASELAEDDEFRTRFIRESKVVASLDHPNVVPIYDAGEAEGLLYMSMRYVDGIDLQTLIAREEYLEPERALSIIAQVGAALDAAHAKGLIHRDVKPANVLLARGLGPKGTDHAYLADFGLARTEIAGTSLTKAGAIYGTLDYIAPEQIEGRPLDARTDVYSLGCVLYQCLVGEVPFPVSSLAKLDAHLRTRPPQPSEKRPELATGFDGVVAKALAKDKDDRYVNAAELVAAIEAIGSRTADTPAPPPAAPDVSEATIGSTGVSKVDAELVGEGRQRASSNEPVRLTEQRKVVTVVAVGIEPTADLDPEDWLGPLDQASALVRKNIEQFGGTILGQVGGSIIGAFGVPVAHEDDPERAVRLGLRIVEQIVRLNEQDSGVGLSVRTGINTGVAVVSRDAGPESGHGIVTGDVVNAASRLQGAAPVGGVGVSDRTYRATDRIFDYEELESVSLQGKAEPMRAWQALHPVARVRLEERDRTPFVGRDIELSMLTQLFERVRSRPTTEFVTIVAEPGLGKSRLVRELARHVEELPNLVTWRVGRCLPYGDGISYWALGEIVKSHAGILETDDQETISSRLDRAIIEPDPQTRAWVKDRLAPLVGLETTTEPPQREEAFTAWRRFLEEVASAGPTALVIEDLHWADEAFVAFLEHLAERTAGLPLLVLVTARPEVEERHPSWPPGRHSTVLSLSPLMDADIETLILQILTEATPELVAIVLDRAGGSPLYAEQLIAMLRENLLPIAGGAVDESVIPASVQSLIAARLDALPAESKRMLMEASVVGKTFWSGAVSALGEHEDVDTTLGELVRREFLRPMHPSTMAGDDEFTFWHSLVRDVAYAELTRAERARMHTATARWIADRTEGAMGGDAEIVVHHVDAALELAQSAPELDTEGLTELLVRALIAAGEATMRTDVRRAIPHLERAMELGSEKGHPVVLLALGRAKRSVGDLAAAVSLFEELRAFHESKGDIPGVVDALIEIDEVMWVMGDSDRADSLLASTKEQLVPGPSLALSKLLAVEATSFAARLEYADALTRAEEALATADALGIEPPALALGARGAARLGFGDLGGEADLRLASDRALREGMTTPAISNLYNLAVGINNFRGPAAGLPYFDEALLLAGRLGMDAEVWGCRAGRLSALAGSGRFDEVLEQSPAISDWAVAHDDAFSRYVVLSSLALVQIEREEGSVPVEELAELARRFNAADLFVAAELALQENDANLARSLVLEGIEAAPPEAAYGMTHAFVETGLTRLAEDLLSRAPEHFPLQTARKLQVRAVLAEAGGDHAGARDAYTDAVAILDMVDSLLERAHALQGLGRCLLTLGETKDGVTRLREARVLWEQMKAPPRISEIDELLATMS